jgi:cysteine synthase A
MTVATRDKLSFNASIGSWLLSCSKVVTCAVIVHGLYTVVVRGGVLKRITHVFQIGRGGERRRRHDGSSNGDCSHETTDHHNSTIRTSTFGEDDYESLIGNTPMIRLNKLSAVLKREIFVKMECMNPSGTGKDRAAMAMIRAAEKEKKQLRVVVEGTSGSTGIALASLCASRKYPLVVVMPDDQAQEKVQLLQCYGAKVHIVPNCAISNPNHYVNTARRLAEQMSDHACFMNQFENQANYMAHYTTTGPEIYSQIRQKRRKLNCFVMSCGTGGTLSGCGKFLKEKDPNIRIILVDPPGSCLYNKIKHGVAFTLEQRERSQKRHRYDTIAEGIGLDRITACLDFGLDSIDDAFLVSDQAAVDMAHWMLRNEGMFVGSSSAMNLVGAAIAAQQLPENSVIVTIVCDSGQRHLTRFWNRDFIVNQRGLRWPGDETKKEISSTNNLPEFMRTCC